MESPATTIDPRPLIENSDATSHSALDTLADFRTSQCGVADREDFDRPWLHPIRCARSFFDNLNSNFGSRYVAWLAIDQFALSGGVMTLLYGTGLPLFQQLGIDAARTQLYQTVIMSPYALKPFVGVASDLIAIRGYHKRYFALGSIIIGLVGCASLLSIYQNGAQKQAVEAGYDSVRRLADLIVLMFMAMNMTGATLDILGESKYSELMRERPESGSSIITFKFAVSLAGSILTRTYVGPLADKGRFHILFWIALAMLLAPVFPTARGWIPESKRRSDEMGMNRICCKLAFFDNGKFSRKRIPFIVIALSGLAAPLNAAVSTYGNLAVGLGFSALVVVGLAWTTFVIFPRVFFKITLGLMLMSTSRIKLGSALNYYYTADEACVPDGPNFSYTFYITVTGIVGSIINLLAILMYQTLMSNWKFRPALAFTILVGSLASLVDVIVIKRWNVAVGIPDHIFFLLGQAVFENLVNILHAVPMSALSAKLTPPGMEAAVFSYSVGIGTFCFLLSSQIGSAIIQSSNMKTVGTDCDFSDLPRLLIVYQTLVPIIVAVPATMLIPNVLQTQQVINWEEEEWYEEEKTDSQDHSSYSGGISDNGDDEDSQGIPSVEAHLL